MKKGKRMLSGMLALLFLATSIDVSTLAVQAEEMDAEIVQAQDVTQYDDVLDGNIVEVPFEQLTEEDFISDEQEVGVEENSQEFQVYSANVASHVYNNDWDKYSTNYYYNQLSAEERRIWDELDAVCLDFLTNSSKNMNEQVIGGDTYYHIGMVESSTLTMDQLLDLGKKFRISNPQYYFLNTSYLYASYGSSMYMALCGYGDFCNGATRETETANVKSKIEEWESQLSTCGSEYEKVKAAHDLIIDAVDYNYGALDAHGAVRDDMDQIWYTQSAYSTLLKGLTVCAGYSMAYEMLLNGAGIDCISLTSSNHQWNSVRVNYTWYNVDCTWDDNGNENEYPILYLYFLDSDSNFKEDESHWPLDEWLGYIPTCDLSTESDWDEPGSLPALGGTTAVPVISANEANDKYTITMSSNDGGMIYYSLDGSNPSVGSTKCYLYSAPFVVDDYESVKAIAVKQNHTDSGVSNVSEVTRLMKINYNLNGGTNNAKNLKTCAEGATVTLYDPTRKGYTFEGWYTDAAFTGEKITSLVDVQTDQTVYAKWSMNTYTISYELNGGTNATSNPNTYTVETSTITLAAPKKTNYVFGGWYSDSSYKTKVTQIAKGSTGNKTLYALWNPIKYNIAFNTNKQTLAGSFKTLSNCSYGTSYKLPTTTTKKTGYVLTWNTKADGKGTAYNAGASVKNLTSTNKATVTLYAIWKPVKYIITYNLNGGTNNSKNPASYYVTTATISLQNPTKKGYTFGGWYSDSGYKNKVTQIAKGSTGNKTLYAKWTLTKYKITYNLNGGTNNSKNPATYTMTTATISLQNPTRKGYTFGGWYSDSGFKTKVTQIAKGSTGNKTLYAKWTATKYKITYNLNSGTNNSKNPATYTIATATIKLVNPTRKGYTFGGWYSDSKFKTKVTQIAKGSTGNKTLYAKWTANKYNVAFNANGGTGKMANEAFVYGGAKALTANAYKKSGYVFQGWNTKKDGTGTWYTNKQSVKNLTATANGTVTLYAMWGQYTVKFDGNGSETGSMANMTCSLNRSYKLPANTFEKTDYVFIGWNTQADGSGTLYTDSSSVKNLAANGKSVTLYAQWEPVETE